MTTKCLPRGFNSGGVHRPMCQRPAEAVRRCPDGRCKLECEATFNFEKEARKCTFALKTKTGAAKCVKCGGNIGICR